MNQKNDKNKEKKEKNEKKEKKRKKKRNSLCLLPISGRRALDQYKSGSTS